MFMSKLLVVAVLAVAVPSAAFACDDHKQAGKSAVKKITLAQAAKFQDAKKATLVDANDPEARAKLGFIPDAILLTSFNQYDANKELPAAKDSKLVFYCANTMCQSSHAAAERALEAGYVDVSVMSEGLAGWKKAGKPIASPRS
jgi:rhodanese-related sulfurtransferase